MKKIIFALFILCLFVSAKQPYIQFTNVTSGTVTITDIQDDVILIHDAGVTATLTIALPATPINGQRIGICSAGGITTLTLSASVGTIVTSLTTMAAGGAGTYLYWNSKWYLNK